MHKRSLKVKASVTQLCPTLCDPMDCSPPGSSVHEFSRQESWSGLPCSPPGDLPDPEIKPGLLHWKQILYHLSHQESLSSLFMGLRIVGIDTYHLTKKIWQSL